jgi:hypothetical protein
LPKPCAQPAAECPDAFAWIQAPSITISVD